MECRTLSPAPSKGCALGTWRAGPLDLGALWLRLTIVIAA